MLRLSNVQASLHCIRLATIFALASRWAVTVVVQRWRWCCPLPAHYLPISSRYSTTVALALGDYIVEDNHLATVSVAVERTGILGLAPLSRSPLRPWLVGSHQRHRLLAMARCGSLHLQSSKGFRVGHSSVTAPAGLASCRLNFRTARPAPCRLVGAGVKSGQMWHCSASCVSVP